MENIKVCISSFDETSKLIVLSPDLTTRERNRKPTDVWLGLMFDTSGSMSENVVSENQHQYMDLDGASPNTVALNRTASSIHLEAQPVQPIQTEIEYDFGNNVKRKLSHYYFATKFNIAMRGLVRSLVCMVADKFIATLSLCIVFYSNKINSVVISNDVRADFNSLIDKLLFTVKPSGGTDITHALNTMLQQIDNRKTQQEQKYVFCITDGFDFGNKESTTLLVRALHESSATVLPTVCIGEPAIHFDPAFVSFLSTGLKDKQNEQCYINANSATEIADKMIHATLGGTNEQFRLMIRTSDPIVNYFVNGKQEEHNERDVVGRVTILSHMFVLIPVASVVEVSCDGMTFVPLSNIKVEIDNEVGKKFAQVLNMRRQIAAYDKAKMEYVDYTCGLSVQLSEIPEHDKHEYVRTIRTMFFNAMRVASLIETVHPRDLVQLDDCTQALQLTIYLLRVENERRSCVIKQLKDDFIKGAVIVDPYVGNRTASSYASPEADSISAPLYVLASRSPSAAIAPPPPQDSLQRETSSTEQTGSAMCSVCMICPKNVMFVPCRHVCVCLECYQTLLTVQTVPQCPLCRTDITNIVTVKGTTDRDCVLCKQTEANCCLLPCSHLVVCDTCLNTQLMSKDAKKNPTCPLCQTNVMMFFSVFT